MCSTGRALTSRPTRSPPHSLPSSCSLLPRGPRTSSLGSHSSHSQVPPEPPSRTSSGPLLTPAPPALLCTARRPPPSSPSRSAPSSTTASMDAIGISNLPYQRHKIGPSLAPASHGRGPADLLSSSLQQSQSAAATSPSWSSVRAASARRPSCACELPSSWWMARRHEDEHAPLHRLSQGGAEELLDRAPAAALSWTRH